MRSMTLLTLLSLAAIACGGDSRGLADEPDDETAPAATETGAGQEAPGLPTEAAQFRPTPGATVPGAEAITGRLWVSAATPVEEEAISLVAQLQNLPRDRSYGWAIHRGDCSTPDDRLFGLGWGAVAEADGRGQGIANTGGPLGEMRLTFTPGPRGEAEETVFVPLDDRLSRARVEGGGYSLRIHPDVEGEDAGPSVACAPLPNPVAGE